MNMNNGTQIPAFGKEMRDKVFVLERGGVFLNHGYIGAVPRPVIEVQDQYIEDMRRRPAHFFMRRKFSLWKEARDAAADFMKADPDSIVLVQSVSMGLNTIINSVTMKDGDSILTTNHNFGAAKKACITKAEKYADSHVYCVDITFPINSEEEVVELYRDFFVSHPHVKIAIIDYISCACAMKLPLDKILEVCKEHKVTSVVDGAHALGHIPIDFSTLQADFFTGCFHKWSFTPWGCAIVWINSNYDGHLKPVATSFRHGRGPLQEFFDQGTRDESAFFSLPAALKFIKDIGGLSKIHEYNTKLIEKGRDYLVRQWGTEKLPMPPSLEAPFLRIIRMPHIPGYDKPSVNAAEILMTEIHERFDIDTCIKYINGHFYLRLSIQIYNTMDDVVKLCNAVLEMKEGSAKLSNEY